MRGYLAGGVSWVMVVGGNGGVRESHGEETAACAGEGVGYIIGLLGCHCGDSFDEFRRWGS